MWLSREPDRSYRRRGNALSTEKRAAFQFALWRAKGVPEFSFYGVHAECKLKMQAKLLALCAYSADRALYSYRAYSVAPAINQLAGSRWANEVADSFHLNCAGPVASLRLHQNNVGGADTHNVEHAE